MQHKATLTKRVLSLVMAIAMLLTLAPLSVFAAGTGTTVYLKPNSNWTQGNAWFAAYYWDTTNHWIKLTDTDSDGIYEGVIPDGYTNVIFCRMNPEKTALDWSSKWDQTEDLKLDGTNNCFTVGNGQWNNATGTWSVYTPSTGDDTDPSTQDTTPSSTPTTPSVTAEYIIAGNNSGVFGTAWDPSNTANGMTLNAETGLYEKTYEDVGIGSLSFKVTDGTWSNCWGGGPNADGDGNYVLSVTAISDVTIRFDASSKTVTAEAVPTGEVQEPVEYVTLHYRNTNVWSQVCAFSWDVATNTTYNGEWPGNALTETEGHANWYTIELTGKNAEGGIGFVFNDGNGNQIDDIVITKSGEYWFDNGMFKEAPASWPDGSVTLVDYEVTLHFANTLNWGGVNLYTWEPFSNGGWPGAATAQDDDGFYTATYTYKAAAGKGLNFIFNGGGQTVDLALKAADFVDGKCERWVVPTTQDAEGKYFADIVTSPEAIAISPVVKDNSVTFEFNKSNWGDTVEVFGSWNDWATGTTMTPNDFGVYSVTVDNVPTGLHEYKFVINGTTWITDPLNNWTENGNSAFLISDPTLDTNTVTIRVHYDAPSTEWNVCAWGADDLEPQYDFVNDVATITLDGRASQYIAFKVRQSIKGNSWYKQTGEIRVDLSNTTSGTIDVYVGTESEGYPVSQKLNGDVVYANKVKSVELDYDNNTVTISTVKAVSDPETAFSFFFEGEASDIVKSVTTNGGSYVFTLNETLDLITLYKYTVHFNEQVKFTDYDYSININTVYASDKFAEEFTYTGTDLGATYTPEITDFVVWAPTAEKVEVALYSTGSDFEEGAAFLGAYTMEKGDKGEWRVDIAGDLKNVYYTYRVTVNGKEVEACDPYARTTGVNGNRAMVTDLPSTNPEGWDDDENPNPVTSYTDAVIYELHVRDFSIDDSSGISEANRGKFMAFTETGTTTPGGHKTGIDYLSELGITHLHLLPIYDYGSVDETKCENFNWGYDPVNYNVPEGSYSLNPYDGNSRVREMKQMVQSLHDADISVVMDVVYNHVYDAGKFCFNQIVPGYFSRVNPDGSYSNGSGCGNDTASEREMVRKYIVESVLYWTEEYHIDGFRFDLVGLLDAETINLIVEEVHKIRPDVIFYGEGWTMGTAVEGGTANTPMATQANAAKTPGFAYFNDRIRNLLGGNNGQSLGFASGLTGQESAVADNFMAKPDWTSNPSQIVQYASCHDNYTLMDKIILSTGKSGIDAESIKMNNLAAAVYMTSQGIPFIHAGEEFLREKLEEDGGRSENSYNAPDSVNHIEWSNLDNTTYANNSKYYQGMIAFRKAHPALRMATTAEVRANVTYKLVSSEVVMFTINAAAIEGETVEKIVVIFNANKSAKSVALPAGDWNVVINDTTAGTETLSTATGTVSVAGISAMVLTQGEIEEPTYKLKLDTAGGYLLVAAATEFEVSEGDSVNKYIDPVTGIMLRDGYTFVEWNTMADGSGETLASNTAMPAGDITYYAIWKEDVAPVDYYLFGYINGANYGCDEDYENMGEYKFVDGTLTATFAETSYVAVKTGDNINWYMTDGWQGEVTSATLYDSSVLDETADKLVVPGGVELTFTLVVNADDTLTLSYTVAEEEKFDIDFAQVILGNALNVNFAFPADAQDDWTGAYAVATKTYADGREDLTVTVPATEWKSATIQGAKHYYFSFSNVSGKEMADNIYVTIYNADDEAISNEYTESIRSYVMRILDDQDAATRTMLVDMLNYGSAAQNTYTYGTDNLANSLLSETQKAYGSTTFEECINNRVMGDNYQGTRLVLKNSILMQFGFSGLTADMTAKIEFTNHRGTKVSETVTPVKLDNGAYAIEVNQIVAADGRIPVTVTVYDADGNVYGTATDSMESYIARMGTTDPLYAAIMMFSDAAYAYLHK